MAAADLLAETEAAISASLTALRYKIGTEREVERNNLDSLRKFRAELMQEIASSGSCGQMCTVGQIDPAR